MAGHMQLHMDVAQRRFLPTNLVGHQLLEGRDGGIRREGGDGEGAAVPWSMVPTSIAMDVVRMRRSGGARARDVPGTRGSRRGERERGGDGAAMSYSAAAAPPAAGGRDPAVKLGCKKFGFPTPTLDLRLR
jgi:hypothetical protein